MPFSATDIAAGFLMPVLITAAFTWLCVRVAGRSQFAEGPPAGDRESPGGGLADTRPPSIRRRVEEVFCGSLIAIVTGCTWLVAMRWTSVVDQWLPRFHWQWLPWMTLCSGAAFAVADGFGQCECGIRRRWGFVVLVAAAALSAWLFVPGWKLLEPSQPVWWGIVGVTSCAIPLLYDAAYRQSPVGGLLLPAAALPGALVAVVILSGSLRFGQMALAGMASVSGIWLGVLRSSPDTDFARRQLVRLSGFVATGCLLTAYLNGTSDVPVAAYLIIALTPLIPGAMRLRSKSTRGGLLPWLLWGLPVVLMIGSVVWVVVQQQQESEW